MIAKLGYNVVEQVDLQKVPRLLVKLLQILMQHTGIAVL